ncbi:flavin reductase, partial [Streptomyces ardesiacus]|uniref:flavin reductase n=1 Tax=Streptomyces ardesiacus TaxID=285564 RepID=UPI00332CE7D8
MRVAGVLRTGAKGVRAYGGAAAPCEDVGMTATAFVSVSLDPPLVLVSLREGSR